MIHTIDSTTTKETDVICDFSKMRPVLRHVRAAFSSLDELERALHIVAFATLHGRYLLSFSHELLEVHFL